MTHAAAMRLNVNFQAAVSNQALCPGGLKCLDGAKHAEQVRKAESALLAALSPGSREPPDDAGEGRQ
jgi:hypothetical protein